MHSSALVAPLLEQGTVAAGSDSAVPPRRWQRAAQLLTMLAMLAFGALGANAWRSSHPPGASARWHALSIDQVDITLRDVPVETPPPKIRCAYVAEMTAKHNAGKSNKTLTQQYEMQATDPNMYYRGVAYMFWEDFVRGGWGEFNINLVVPSARLADGSALSRTSTWTWVSGDQHLSNFGAWRNRHGDVVYGINDFDEAAIYDFQMDIWRLAVSVYDHALSNGLSEAQAQRAVIILTDWYVATIGNYIGNELAMLHELTPENVPSGPLARFLEDVDGKDAQHKQLSKFTEVRFDGLPQLADLHSWPTFTVPTSTVPPVTTGRPFFPPLRRPACPVSPPPTAQVGPDGLRRFAFNEASHLAPVPKSVRDEIVRAMAQDGYGATMQKIGWRTHEWSDDFFQVRDVARRLGSGDGSFGVARYYVMLAGTDATRRDAQSSSQSRLPLGEIILDVKFTPQPAIREVLLPQDRGWYGTLFRNEGARAIEAQRRLTSYTDPFLGWVTIFGQVHVVSRAGAPRPEPPSPYPLRARTRPRLPGMGPQLSRREPTRAVRCASARRGRLRWTWAPSNRSTTSSATCSRWPSSRPRRTSAAGWERPLCSSRRSSRPSSARSRRAPRGVHRLPTLPATTGSKCSRISSASASGCGATLRTPPDPPTGRTARGCARCLGL